MLGRQNGSIRLYRKGRSWPAAYQCGLGGDSVGMWSLPAGCTSDFSLSLLCLTSAAPLSRTVQGQDTDATPIRGPSQESGLL